LITRSLRFFSRLWSGAVVAFPIPLFPCDNLVLGVSALGFLLIGVTRQLNFPFFIFGLIFFHPRGYLPSFPFPLRILELPLCPGESPGSLSFRSILRPCTFLPAFLFFYEPLVLLPCSFAGSLLGVFSLFLFFLTDTSFRLREGFFSSRLYSALTLCTSQPFDRKFSAGPLL